MDGIPIPSPRRRAATVACMLALLWALSAGLCAAEGDGGAAAGADRAPTPGTVPPAGSTVHERHHAGGSHHVIDEHRIIIGGRGRGGYWSNDRPAWYDDRELTLLIQDQLRANPLVDEFADDLAISARDGVVVVSGRVRTEKDRQLVEQAIGGVDGVKRLHSRLVVGN